MKVNRQRGDEAAILGVETLARKPFLVTGHLERLETIHECDGLRVELFATEKEGMGESTSGYRTFGALIALLSVPECRRTTDVFVDFVADLAR